MEFSELAIQKLLQLFPELSSFIVTFRDITDETSALEETDVSVGMFILQVGDKYFYLPVIAKGDAIQPMDSLFDNEEQVFLPLTKGFVTKALNSSQMEMGKPTKIPQSVPQNPSIYSLVTPPRTGKFVYASSSKLEEFLSVLPNMVKKAVLDEFSTDKDIYSALHKLFGLENIVSSLKPTPSQVTVQPKPAIELITDGSNLDNDTIQSILSKGYALRGENTSTRIAVEANDFLDMGQLRELSSADAGQDFDVCTTTGETRTAFLPKNSKYIPRKPALFKNRNSVDNIFAIFNNGEFILTHKLIGVGEGRDGKKALQDYLSVIPPITPNELSSNMEYFALFSTDLELIGLYDMSNVTKTAYGVTISARSLLDDVDGDTKVIINAYRNCTTVNCEDRSNIFVPTNTVVVTLGKKLWEDSSELAQNINHAAARLELATRKILGSAVDIAHDGVEFIVNKQPVGTAANVMRILVIEEGVDPIKAESFVKQAQEQKHIRVYMSKKADAEQDLIPSYGEIPPQQQPGFGINGDFTNNVNQAIQTNDAEVVESTIISELLQVTEMKSYIKEYLPDIKNSLDKLGRALFLCRLKMDQLAIDHTASEVFSFIANLRNTYRNLGDTYLKLEDMVSDSELMPVNNDK